MRKSITSIIAAVLIVAAVAMPKPAEARCWGCWAGAGIAAGIIGGAIIASYANAYGYGAYSYGYPGYGYGYGYAPYAYAPAYYGYYAPPVVRAYYAPRPYVYARRYYVHRYYR
jgi:hypothetical protein